MKRSIITQTQWRYLRTVGRKIGKTDSQVLADVNACKTPDDILDLIARYRAAQQARDWLAMMETNDR